MLLGGPISEEGVARGNVANPFQVSDTWRIGKNEEVVTNVRTVQGQVKNARVIGLL